MTDTKRWIADVRREPASDLWADVERRAALGETHRDAPHAHPSRAAAGLVAALALIGTTLYALRDLGGSNDNPAVPGPGEIVRYPLDGPPQPIAVGEGAAWVHIGAGTGTISGLVRIDAVTGEVRMLDVPGGDWPAVGGGSAWLLCNAELCRGGSGSVLQIDPVTGEVLRTVALPGRGVQIVGTPTGVWVTTDAGAAFVDSDGEVGPIINGHFNLIGADGASLWVSTDSGLRGFDITNGHEVAQVPFGDACTMEVADGMVWVASCGGGLLPLSDRDALMGIDAATGRVLFNVAIEGYGQMRYSDGVLWIAEHPRESQSIRLVPFGASSGLLAGEPIEIQSNDGRFIGSGLFPLHVFFAVGEGSAWFTDFGAGEVIRLGLPTLNVEGAQSSSPSPEETNGHSAVALPEPTSQSFGAGSNWVIDRDGLVRLDRSGTIVATIPGLTGKVAASETAVWVLAPSGMLSRIDPSTNAIVTTISVPIENASHLAVGGDSVWIARDSDLSLVRVDTSADQAGPKTTIPCSSAAACGLSSLAASAETCWVGLAPGSQDSSQVVGIDAVTGEVTATVPSGGRLGVALAVGEGSVWGAGLGLDRIDPVTGELVEHFDLEGVEPPDGFDVAVGAGYVWVIDQAGLVLQVEPKTGHILARTEPFPDVFGLGDATGSPDGVWVIGPNGTVVEIRPH